MDDLLEENRTMLRRFAAKGVDLSKSYEFDFRVSLADMESCKQVRQLFRDKYGALKNGLFMFINDPEDYQLSLSLKLIPSAEAVTDIERKLLDIAKDFVGAEVTWEFRAK